MEPAVRSVVVAPGPFNGVKVFSATMHAQRGAIGDVITTWIERNPQCSVREMIVSQSSDASFHCYSFAIFYWEDAPAARARA
jgi:hypothetical protein